MSPYPRALQHVEDLLDEGTAEDNADAMGGVGIKHLHIALVYT